MIRYIVFELDGISYNRRNARHTVRRLFELQYDECGCNNGVNEVWGCGVHDPSQDERYYFYIKGDTYYDAKQFRTQPRRNG